MAQAARSKGAHKRLLLIVAATTIPAQTAMGQIDQTAAQGMRVVNVTAGSEAGWVPSEALEHEALAAAETLLAALERGDDALAYSMMAEGFPSQLSSDQYASDNRAFRADAGQLVRRRFNQMTWTKDSSTAPLLGTYAAIDIVAKYEKIDRFCGYIMLHKANATAPFRVSRIERYYIANSAAAAMSANALRSSWQQLATNCPNFRPIDLEEAQGSTTGYASVAAALADLRSRHDVKFEDQNGWTVATDEANLSIWSFAPPDYPAYPAVVKRHVYADEAGTHMAMNVQCEASKEACDALVRTFAELNGLPLP